VIEEKIRQLYQIVDELEAAYPDKHFTLDGVLLGSLGEVYARDKYGLTLFKDSHKTHDAITTDGKLVQIKVTQGDKIGMRSEPDFLLVFQVLRDGSFVEIYNGAGKRPWEESGKMRSNGQRFISVSHLKEIQDKRCI